MTNHPIDLHGYEFEVAGTDDGLGAEGGALAGGDGRHGDRPDAAGIEFVAKVSPKNVAAGTTGNVPSAMFVFFFHTFVSVLLGGTSLMGGRATIVGTFLGVLTFALIFSLMTQLNLSTEIQQVTKGAIVLGAVLLQRPEARFK